MKSAKLEGINGSPKTVGSRHSGYVHLNIQSMGKMKEGDERVPLLESAS